MILIDNKCDWKLSIVVYNIIYLINWWIESPENMLLQYFYSYKNNIFNIILKLWNTRVSFK